MTRKDIKFETIAVRGASFGDKETGAISFPIYQSATFKHHGLNQSTGYDYSRTKNPTRFEVEQTVNLLEGGVGALGFSTGVAAITCCLHLFVPGDHVIVSEDLYGGTFRLFNDIFSAYKIKASFVDTSNLDAIKASITSDTKAIFIETPSNPTMRVSEIAPISEICKENSLLLIVDNTFLTPYLQKPLALGADIVVHSGTKFLGGHNDVLAGFMVTKHMDIYERLRIVHNAIGATLSPMDSWLVLRGMKTLHLRMDRAEQNAIKIAKWLKTNKNIEKVYYVGLEDHIGYEENLKQAKGFGSTLSFTVKDVAIIPSILKDLKVISFAESLGGVETLITYPQTQTHAEMPKDLKDKLGVNDRLLRLSVGIEDIEDLINDLKSVLGE